MPALLPSLRFADVSELHSQLDRNPVNPQPWWWTQHRCECICVCMCMNKHALSAWPIPSVPAGRTWDGSFSSLTAPSVKPERAGTESRRDRRRYEKAEKTLRQSVSLNHFRASHHRRYQHITAGSLKAFTALWKHLVSVFLIATVQNWITPF